METIDRAAEYRRLKDVYAHMSDDELQAVAEDGSDLTEVATQVVRAEIARRGLDIKIQDTPEQPVIEERPSADAFDPSNLDLVVGHRVSDITEALQAKAVFDAAGIPSWLGPDNLENVDDFKSSFEGGVDFKVRDVDQQRAFRALSESLPQPQESDKGYVAICPKCHSPEIVFQGLEQVQGSASSSKYIWSCDACGHRWEDDGVEEEAGDNRCP